MASITRIVVLNDGETFSDIEGCKVIECPGTPDLEDVKDMLVLKSKSWDITTLIELWPVGAEVGEDSPFDAISEKFFAQGYDMGEAEHSIDKEYLDEKEEEITALQKDNKRLETIVDNAVALLECLNIPVDDIYPTDEEEDEIKKVKIDDQGKSSEWKGKHIRFEESAI
jgi:hypothetical protein